MTDQPHTDDQSTDPSASTVTPMADDPCAAKPSDCKEAVEQLYEYLDGELTPEKRSSIGAHVDACGHCLDAYEFHADLKAVISQKCHTDLPVGLRDRVFDALRALDT